MSLPLTHLQKVNRRSKAAAIGTAVACGMIALGMLEHKIRGKPMSSGGFMSSGRRLEDTDDDGDKCSVSIVADPLGQYLPEGPVAVVFYLVGMFYMFFGLGFVCEEYFVASIEAIIETYNVPPDVAGATLMAAGE